MNFKKADAMGVIEAASGCVEHPATVEIAEADIATVHYFDNWCNCGHGDKMCATYCDTGSIAVVTLTDGRLVLAEEDSDTSGHG